MTPGCARNPSAVDEEKSVKTAAIAPLNIGGARPAVEALRPIPDMPEEENMLIEQETIKEQWALPEIVLTNCTELGLLTEGECRLCEEIPDAECILSMAKNTNAPCFECQEKQILCQDLGLLEQNECTLCREITSAVCRSKQLTKQGRQCFECALEEDADSVKTENPVPELSEYIEDVPGDNGINDLTETDTVSELQEESVVIHSLAEVPSEDLIDFKIIEVMDQKPDIEIIEEKIIITETIVAEETAQTPEINLFVDLNYNRHFAEDSKEIVLAVKPQGCESLGVMNLKSCNERCPHCKASGQVQNGEECFECNVPLGDNQCLEEDSHVDCSACSENEKCQPLGLIVFYNNGNGKSPLLNCYGCFAIANDQMAGIQ